MTDLAPCRPRVVGTGFRPVTPLDGPLHRALEISRARLLLLGAVFALAFLVVGGRLVHVTMLQDPSEPRIAATTARGMETERADIVDRNGALIATSLPTPSLSANPRQVQDPADAAARLARVFPDLAPGDLLAKLREDRSFVWIKRQLTPREQDAVNRLGIPGLHFHKDERRVYPHGPLASHILGFAGVDNVGLQGVERTLDDRLRGAREPLRLSLDIGVQHVIHAELAAAIAEFRAIGGMAIVMDVDTAEIVSMVSLPDFDPNRPATATQETLFNRNTLGVYEMGSVFKIFTTAMALDSGKTTLRGGYDASRPIHVSRFTIDDYKPKRRWLSVPEIFKYSSNIGSVKMVLDVGVAHQRAFLDRLGFLGETRIELPEIGAPLVPNPWRDINAMTIAFGHGLSITPLQLVTATAAMVNGGILRQPTLLKQTYGDERPGVRVIKARTSDDMRGLLRLVVEDGTGKKADAKGYAVGGKTGSAEKASGRGYRRKALLSSFLGAFPMTRPRYAVLVMIDEPQATAQTHGYATGGWVAAPVVARIVARTAPMLGIAPMEVEPPQPRQPLVQPVSAPGRGAPGRGTGAPR